MNTVEFFWCTFLSSVLIVRRLLAKVYNVFTISFVGMFLLFRHSFQIKVYFYFLSDSFRISGLIFQVINLTLVTPSFLTRLFDILCCGKDHWSV